jgi:hypothetical protein
LPQAVLGEIWAVKIQSFVETYFCVPDMSSLKLIILAKAWP